MKKLFFLFLVCCFSWKAEAQTFKNTGSGLNEFVIDKDDTASKDEEESDDATSNKSNVSFDQIEMDQEDKQLSFSQLPEGSPLTIYVTDARGNELLNKAIDKKKNTVPIKKWRKGVYFATVIDENKDKRKSFVVTIQ